MALGVPILETASSLFRRLVSGRNVMQADRRHLFHFLSMAGLSPGRVILIFYSLSATFGLFSLGMLLWNRRLVFSLLVLFMVVIFVAFLILVNNLPRSTGRHGRPRDSA
jgi:UDP-GlcNAc:undecaprenyl-phosphate GlcNAc-1-phosphate transferase